MAKTFVLCDGTRYNSYGFRTNVRGIDLERFNANPVMLYEHERDEVIGRWEHVRIEGEKLLADAVFDTEDERAARVAGQVERGFLNGCSMGLRIRNMMDDVAVESELVEASIVSVPSDAGAVALYDDESNMMSLEEANLKYGINNKNEKMTAEELKKRETELEEAKLSLESCKTELAAKEQANLELQERVSKLEAAIAERDKEAVRLYLNNAVSDGRIGEKEVAGFEKLAAADFETVKSIIESRDKKPSMLLSDMVGKQSTTDVTEMSWDDLDKAGRLAELKASDPDMYEKKFNEKFKKQ